MDRKTVQVALISCAVGAGIVGALVLLFPATQQAPMPPTASPSATITPAESKATALADEATGEVIDAKLEIDISEFKYLPKEVGIGTGDSTSPLLKMPTLINSARRVSGVRPLTDKSRQGAFLAPRWSPDGLQMLVSRPGFDGVYIVDVTTGESRRIADGNSFNAKWNADGTLDVRAEDGTVRTYDADGTLLSTRPAEDSSGNVFAEENVIYARTPGGGTMPITGNDDRYFNPVVSPDGSTVVYQGLLTGLYMAAADGSSEPVYIGRGNNPQWMPDSSGLVFDVTADDGHHLTEGDIFFVDRDQTERTNLTPGDELVSQMPTVDPTGSRVAFEADGNIYVGEVQ